ncbi:hypothetical protein EJ07DRAFT_151963 [Lizonia empirigonia]|nr:hypothetical protein EJ07DRAFT_151963 [Lizonia empirigonia]
MHVDAKAVPGSSTLAIVVTLVSVALLSFSLRLYTRGRLLHSLGTDDWLLLVAALCIIGVLAITIVLSGLEKQTWPTLLDNDHTASLLAWVVTLLHILGLGFIKLSVALTILKLAHKNWYRHTALGFICLTTVVTVLWLGSALLFGGPITVEWSSTSESEAIWRLLGFVNSVLDVVTNVLVALLPNLVIWHSRFGPSAKLALLAIYTFTAAAVAAAVVRTVLLHTVWQNKDLDSSSSITMLCSSIELTSGMVAASLFILQPMASSISQCLSSRGSKHLSATSTSPPHRYPSHPYASTDTVIHRPNAPHLLSIRFHDDESNLDFDIETPNTRTRTHTLRSRGTHSRNVSDWSQFSGFTYYTTTANSVHEASPRRSRVVSMNEMEVRTRTIGVGRPGVNDKNIGVAVTTLHDDPVRESEAGEEMAELARLFADKSKDWGGESSRSVRTSVASNGTRRTREYTRDGMK